MNPNDWLSLAQVFGPTVSILLIAFILGARRVWVWGYQLKDCEARGKVSDARADKWERHALRGTTLADNTTEVASQVINLAKKLGGEDS